MAKSDMKEDMKADKKQDVALIKKAFKEHDAQEHKGGKGTTLKLKKGGSAGGKRNIDMKTMGRNLAKIAAQKRG
jgi:DNA mismatch repair protein MutH